jgi:hypothetical protein
MCVMYSMTCVHDLHECMHDVFACFHEKLYFCMNVYQYTCKVLVEHNLHTYTRTCARTCTCTRTFTCTRAQGVHIYKRAYIACKQYSNTYMPIHNPTQARDIYGNKRTMGRYDPIAASISGEFFQSSVRFEGALQKPTQCACSLGVCTQCEVFSCGSTPTACGTPSQGYPKVTNYNDGTYGISYIITQAASYTIAIRKQFGAEMRHILGSPFRLALSPGPTDPLSTTSQGEGLTRTVAGDNATAVIQTRDMYGNLRGVGGDAIRAVAQSLSAEACTRGRTSECVLCTASDELCIFAGVAEGRRRPVLVQATIHDLGNGDYTMLYVVTVSGPYSLSIRLNNTHLGGRTSTRSPFAVICSPAELDPEKSTVSGEGARLVTLRRESSFQLWPRDRWGNSLAGARDRIRITLCNTGATCAPRADTAFISMKFWHRDKGRWHDVQDKFVRTDAARPDASKGPTITVEVRGNPDSSASVIFVMDESGEYLVFVDFQSKAIMGSPFNMSVYPEDLDADPSKCDVTAGDESPAGRRATAVLTVRNKYGLLIPEASVKIAQVAPYLTNPAVVEPRVVSRLNGTFLVLFTATRAGQYSMTVTVSSPAGGFREIPGSPVSIRVVPFSFEPSSSVAFVSDIQEVEAGTVIEFSMISRDPYGNELPLNAADNYAATLVRADGSDRTVQTALITPAQQGGFLGRFQSATGGPTTTRSGAYRLTVTNVGIQVINSPFIINVMPSSLDILQCTISMDATTTLSSGSLHATFTAGIYASIYIQVHACLFLMRA